MPKKSSKDIKYFQAVGRRKNAVASVRLYITTGKEKTTSVNGKKVGLGEIIVNDMPLAKAFTNPIAQKRCLLPLELTDNLERFAISIKVSGGGMNGQLEAIMHGIARAIVVANPDEYKTILRQNELLTRDPRTRERRKVGMGGKARRAKQSPKR